MAYYGLQVSWKGSGVDEYKLKWFFNPFGALDIIMENSRYGSSQNSAFIKFPTQQIAESAQRQTNGSSLQGCIIQTTVQRRAALITPSFQPYQSEARLQQYSHQSQEQLPPPNPPKNVDRKTLVVNNLNPITSEASLRKVFNEYHCTTISIPKNQQRGAQIHGFVSFSRDSDASTAMEQINGRVIDRHKVEISYKPLRSSSASQLRPLSDFKSYTYPPQSQFVNKLNNSGINSNQDLVTRLRRVNNTHIINIPIQTGQKEEENKRKQEEYLRIQQQAEERRQIEETQKLIEDDKKNQIEIQRILQEEEDEQRRIIEQNKLKDIKQPKMNVNVNDNSNNNVECPFCGVKFEKEHIVNHIDVHNEEQQMLYAQTSSLLHLLTRNEQGQYKNNNQKKQACPFCSNDSEILDYHIRNHHNNDYSLFIKLLDHHKQMEQILPDEKQINKDQQISQNQEQQINQNQEQQINQNQEQKINLNKQQQINQKQELQVNQNKQQQISQNKELQINQNQEQQINQNQEQKINLNKQQQINQKQELQVNQNKQQQISQNKELQINQNKQQQLNNNIEKQGEDFVQCHLCPQFHHYSTIIAHIKTHTNGQAFIDNMQNYINSLQKVIKFQLIFCPFCVYAEFPNELNEHVTNNHPQQFNLFNYVANILRSKQNQK